MELDPTLENLSEAFGFSVPKTVQGMVEAALALDAKEPHRAFEALGIELGGPLFPFLGGSPCSLREPFTPPEFFPFACRTGDEVVHYGFVVDDPDKAVESDLFVGLLAPDQPELCGVIASSLTEFFSLLVSGSEESEELDAALGALERGLDVKRSSVDSQSVVEKTRSARSALLSYQTADSLGLVVPEEPAPLELMHHEFRQILIGGRDRDKIRQAGRRALQVGAPGAALALARDLTWLLGERTHWCQIALELYEEVYPTLGRPLLARVARREWVRHYGRRG